MSDISYVSTRGGCEAVPASVAILKGIAEDGGLFVPEKLPTPNWNFDAMMELDYRNVAFTVLREFLTDFKDEELLACINAAYDEKFDTPLIAPVVKAGDEYFLELYHGATAAFKDMALSLLPHLLVASARKNNVKDEIVILTATSGDTGKAALAGFADVPGTRIIVFYPKNGVSAIQERQMITQEGENTCVIGISGNFDDAQTGVKKMFTNADLKTKLAEKGFRFSSANSINIGRLVPQVAYYVWTYCQLLKSGEIHKDETINFVVPTGNFGNILAGYYAKLLGLPINKLICASNDNKVLTDFFNDGTYDRNREFILTESPSMDILISSNLERLIYMAAGDDAKKNAALMKDLIETGKYTITEDMQDRLDSFYGDFATGDEMAAAIRAYFETENYCMDTHTAVAAAVLKKYKRETGDTHKNVIVSTASPYKFTASVLKAITPVAAASGSDPFVLADALEKLIGVKQPATIIKARNSEIRHNNVCETEDMQLMVEKQLGL